jgi:hypothetical protein
MSLSSDLFAGAIKDPRELTSNVEGGREKMA